MECVDPSSTMKPIVFAVPAALLLASVTPLSFAQETRFDGPIEKVEKQDLFEQLLGYWVVDFDSAATKSMFAMTVGDEGTDSPESKAGDLKKHMAGVTFEIRKNLLLDYDSERASRTTITVKSQDPKTRTLVTEFQSEGSDKPDAVTIVFDGEHMTMSGKDGDGQEKQFGLKRIDKEAFEKRVPEALRKDKPMAEANKKPLGVKGGYPIAAPVPDKEGFVFSPYSGQVIDVRDLPSGTLVMDPQSSPEEKKYFRVP